MNYLKKQMLRNKLINQIRQSNRVGSHSGCIRLFKNNTKEHEMAKTEIAYILMNKGFEIWSETIFNNGSRADLISISPDSNGYIIEIMCSETLEELKEKIKKYPVDFEVIPIKLPLKEEDLEF